MRAQKFVAQITVAMFDVYEIKAEFLRNFRGAVKFFDDGANLAVGQNGKVASQSQSLVQDRMMIND